MPSVFGDALLRNTLTIHVFTVENPMTYHYSLLIMFILALAVEKTSFQMSYVPVKAVIKKKGVNTGSIG